MMLNPKNLGRCSNPSDIAAAAIVAWRAPSPSSPAPVARRYAASGLDCSVRPSKLAAMPLTPHSRVSKSKFTFTEPSYTKLLTLPNAPVTHY
jgi:hypothetical protein